MSESATVESLAEDIGRQMSGEHTAPVAAQSAEPQFDGSKFSFDADFQSKLTALVVRDAAFNESANGLVLPEYFENAAEAEVVRLGLAYWSRYRRAPDKATFNELFKKAVAVKKIRKDLVREVAEKIVGLWKHDIGDRKFAVDAVAEFAQEKAVEAAILKSADLIARPDPDKFSKIKKALLQALEVGAQADSTEYDYFKEIASRTQERLDIACGKLQPKGISTGHNGLDGVLFHKGFGRGELTILMGGAKSGKSTGLLNFAKNASVGGYNVLYVTLEMSKEIAAHRLDAALADVLMKELGNNINLIQQKVEEIAAKSGALKMHEFPSGTAKPSMIRRLINHYKAKGLVFDLVVVDYLDIMAPEYRYNDDIANSKSIWVDMRAIAQEEGFAMLSATQTNRDGFKASVAKAEHVAEDFNKIRIADLTISINATDDERLRGEARLYFAASRNQEGGFSLVIKQDLGKMKFITKVLRRE